MLKESAPAKYHLFLNLLLKDLMRMLDLGAFLDNLFLHG